MYDNILSFFIKQIELKQTVNHITIYLFYFLIFTSGIVQAQSIPPAGTIIKNVATMIYSNAEDGIETRKSNDVNAVVDVFESVTIVYDQVKLNRKGEFIDFDHTITNRGNVETIIYIYVTNNDNDDYDYLDLAIEVIVSNLNKNQDNRLPGVTAAQLAYSLAVNEAIDIKVSGKIPTDVRVDMKGSIEIEIVTANQQFTTSNRDSVIIKAGTVMEINKLILTKDVKQGDELEFQINGKNVGDAFALAIPISVDSKEERFVLVRDKIPSNTSFSQFTFTGKGTPLYHTLDSPELVYSTTPPEDLTLIDEVAFGYVIIDVEETFEIRFAVKINDNANGNIKNIAFVIYDDGLGEQITEGASNEVVTDLPEYEANLSFFNDPNYTEETATAITGRPLYLEADAAGCNVDFALVDTTFIQLQSAVTGDTEMFKAVETGRNTGRFRIEPNVQTRDFNLYPPTNGNGIMEISSNDQIVTTLQDCGGLSTSVIANVFVDPHGIVFDSESNQPIPGAEVYIYEVSGNSETEATVYNYNKSQILPSRITTNSEGKFQYTRLEPGIYRIDVMPPKGYLYPSKLDTAFFADNRTITLEGSYGLNFTVNAPNGAVNFDIPLDVDGQNAMTLEKKVNTQEVEIGEFLTYTLILTNTILSDISNVIIDDILPFGFSYMPGTSRLGGAKIADPVGGSGPALQYTIPVLSAGNKVELSYRILAGPGSVSSDGINRASAVSDEVIVKLSNVAKVKVEVRKGVFSEDAFVVGKVFYDINKNNVQEEGEPGIPGIRLFMENGNFVITDAYGRYSFYGISPRKHILKLDVTTIPKGSGLLVLDNRHAGDPQSRFVDLHEGELHAADFAICAVEKDVTPEINNRFNKAIGIRTEFEETLSKRLQENTSQRNRNRRSMPSNGFVGKGDEKAYATINELDPENEENRKTDWLTHLQRPELHGDLQEIVTTSDDSFQILNLTSGDSLKSSIVSVQLKARRGTGFNLFINDIQISDEKVGARIEIDINTGWEFVGVTLSAGKNELRAQTVDPFGNIRDEKRITLYAPGKLHSIAVIPDDVTVAASGEGKVGVRIELRDEYGMLVPARTEVNLDISYANWMVEDINDVEPGIQQFIEGGSAVTAVSVPMESGRSLLKVKSSNLTGEAVIDFVPDLRPLIAAGIIEGTLRLRDGFRIDKSGSGDGFESELRSLSMTQGPFKADARTVFFLKGKIKGDYLLTAGFDSEKDEDALFRSIQPEEYYPVYGDASVKGYDAQSSGKLFVRVDKNRSYALLGDFTTMNQNPAQKLGTYNRNLTGVKWHYETETVRANAGGTQAVNHQMFEEFPALGISGSYPLKRKDIVEGSEIVEIVTRDRNQPDIILYKEPLTRFLDYSIDPFAGHLLFKFPISSLDEELNPRSIRISYDTDDPVNGFLIANADASVKVTKNLEIGGSVT